MDDRTVTIARTFHLDAAHRLWQHAGACRHLHGHRYAVRVVVRGPIRDDGMVVDFHDLQRTAGAHLVTLLDHCAVLDRDDPCVAELRAAGHAMTLTAGQPTAEVLAATLLDTLRHVVSDLGATLIAVRVSETPDCWAEAE